jgi:hypothetical protein
MNTTPSLFTGSPTLAGPTRRVGDRLVGADHPVYVTGEIGINHNGDLDIAFALIVDVGHPAPRSVALDLPLVPWGADLGGPLLEPCRLPSPTRVPT